MNKGPNQTTHALGQPALGRDQYKGVGAGSDVDGAGGSLVFHYNCSWDAFESASQTATATRVCSFLRICQIHEFETVAPTRTSDRVCQALSACVPGQYQSTPPASHADRECSPITSCDVLPNGQLQYEAIPPKVRPPRRQRWELPEVPGWSDAARGRWRSTDTQLTPI